MAADNLVGISSFDEAVRRIIAVFCEPGACQTEGDFTAVPTELQVRQCLDELLCCHELRTHDFVSDERLQQKRLQRCHQSWQRRADLTGKIAVDKASAADREAAMQLQARAEVKQTEQELAARERDMEERRQDMDMLNHRLESREAALSRRELAVQASERNLEVRDRKDMDVLNHSLQTREAALSDREIALQTRESSLENRERKDMDALNHKLKNREDALSKRELAVQARESNLGDKERKDMDVLSHRLESREAALSKRELAVRAREATLEDRERNVAVHELKVEEERRLLAEADRAQRGAVDLHQRQVAEQRARCAEAERKLGERAEAMLLREQSTFNAGADAQRVPKPPAPPEAASALAAWEARLASRDRALAESRRDQEAQERVLRERERHLGDVDVPQISARGPDPAPRLTGPAALPPAAHHSRPGSLDSTTFAARGVPHDANCGDLNSGTTGQKSRKTARKRVHDNGVADTAIPFEARPAEGASILASADMDLGAHDAGPSSKRHAAEPHRVTSAFARFAGPLSRLLGGGEAPASPG